jgi:hypothetical protein
MRPSPERLGGGNSARANRRSESPSRPAETDNGCYEVNSLNSHKNRARIFSCRSAVLATPRKLGLVRDKEFLNGRLTVVSSLITGWLEFCETEALGEGGKEVETFADRLPARRSVPFDVSSDGGDGEQDVVVGGVGG